jgi:transcriptional regulator with XRE-family HTH domain
MSFGAFIRQKREAKGIQMNDFAAQLKLSPAYWSRIERDKENPPKDEYIRQAAEILEADVDEAFIQASRLPPDMQSEVGSIVRMYRRQSKVEK